MTVADLIEKLKTVPPDAEVTSNGFEVVGVEVQEQFVARLKEYPQWKAVYTTFPRTESKRVTVVSLT